MEYLIHNDIYGKSILNLRTVLFQINFHLNQKTNFLKINNQFNRYYTIIQTILDIDPKTIHEELVTALRPTAPSYTIVTRWAKHFREGKEDVNDDPGSASPVSKFTGENIELVRQVISNDPHSTYDEIIPDASLSHDTIQRIIHDCLKMKKVTSRWVSHQPTNEQKQRRVKPFHENLAKFQNVFWRLRDIITGDEMWIYHRQIHHK